MDSLWDFSHSPSVKTCNTTIPDHVYLYGYVIWAGSVCCVFEQLGIQSGTNLGETHCYSKTNGHTFCSVAWSNLPILGIDGLINSGETALLKREDRSVLTGKQD